VERGTGPCRPFAVVPVAVEDEGAVDLRVPDREDRDRGLVDCQPVAERAALVEELCGVRVVVRSLAPPRPTWASESQVDGMERSGYAFTDRGEEQRRLEPW
jgi:hypothetical protein